MRIRRLNEDKINDVPTSEDLVSYGKVKFKIFRVAKWYIDMFPEKLDNVSEGNFISDVNVAAGEVNIEVQDMDAENTFDAVRIPIDTFIEFWRDPEQFRQMKKFNL